MKEEARRDERDVQEVEATHGTLKLRSNDERLSDKNV